MTEDSNRAEADIAFSKALTSGRLSRNPHAANYVGHYDYMGSSVNGGDSFKNYHSREYLPAEIDTNDQDGIEWAYLPTFWRRNGW